MRLVNGDRVGEGRVEVMYNGAWGTVCDDTFGEKEALVVCKSLGYESGEIASFNHFGSGSGLILLDNMQCNGTEESLLECNKGIIGSNDCSHREDVGLSCTGEQAKHIGEMRLVGGDGDHEGRVEIFYWEWGTVCDDNFDAKAATVVCKYFGYKRGHPVSNKYGPGEGRILLDMFECETGDKTLADCGDFYWGLNNCNHSEDAGVRCELEGESSLRLVGGRGDWEGRVEILHDGEWGTICDDEFNLEEAQVVCRSLGFSNGDWRTDAFFGAGEGRIWLDDFNCDGHEEWIEECNSVYWGINNCSHNEDAGVSCYNGDDEDSREDEGYSGSGSGSGYGSGTESDSWP
ncbi:hypothetical protein CAPTEDRAFT_153473 [Capitella teleta]|uniref:SRCR domain-containing protein n=1 Tax=Capitella teleta TaxID=283909 RepID=R7TQJ7_CAPTE|nr:hypothetical protein CAPTEDRAFT_153473 [Capitella teleta]|eukprot:ELT95812.1 hypothetical protein CAPTEDRAFT_153473 [Capitella teleta]